MLRHLQEVAHDDVDSVRRLKAKHLGPEFSMGDKKQGEGAVGDIIITDDYHVNDPSVAQQPPPLLVPLPQPKSKLGAVVAGIVGTVGSLLGTAGVVALILSMRPKEQTPVTQPAPVTTPAPATQDNPPKAPAWDAVYEEKQPDGTWKEVKREPLKTRKDRDE